MDLHLIHVSTNNAKPNLISSCIRVYRKTYMFFILQRSVQICLIRIYNCNLTYYHYLKCLELKQNFKREYMNQQKLFLSMWFVGVLSCFCAICCYSSHSHLFKYRYRQRVLLFLSLPCSQWMRYLRHAVTSEGQALIKTYRKEIVGVIAS